MVIYLLGYMGSGKTVVGKALAEALGFSFVDTDEWIIDFSGMSINEYFDKNGENAFRTLEKKAIQTISESSTNLVVATGGGLPCFNKNVDYIIENGLCIYLMASISDICVRLEQDNSRPIVKGKSRKELHNFISNHLQIRKEYYKQAQIKVWNRGSIKNIVHRLMKKIDNKTR